MPSTPNRTPDLLLEQLALGELPPVRAAALRERLAWEEGGLARLEALEASDTAILDTYAPAVMKAGFEARRVDAGGRRRAGLGGRVLAPAVTMAALLFALVIPFFGERPDEGEGDGARPPWQQGAGVRTKGDPQLSLHLKTTTGSEPLASGAMVRPGDRIGLRYLSAGARHGVILSVDARGVVSLHFPDRPGGSTALDEGGPQDLPFAYELDDTPGAERFWLVTGAEPVDVHGLIAALKRIGGAGTSPLDPGAGLRAMEVRLVKPTAGREGPL
jgi:hypothetical protein